MGEFPRRAGGDLENVAAGLRADPLAGAGEEEALESRHAAVVPRRLLVEDPPDAVRLVRDGAGAVASREHVVTTLADNDRNLDNVDYLK